MKLKRSSYGALIFAVICFVNPNFNAFDFLPDFIGAFIIAALLTRAEDAVPYIAEAKNAFVRLGITSLVRLPAALIMFGNLHTGMDIVPLFTLTFTVLELIFLISGVANGARGLYYLAERSDALGIVRPFRVFGLSFKAESVKPLAILFLAVRGACNFLPQICHLTYSDERVKYVMNRLYAPLELGGMAIVLLFGIFFAVVAISYIRSVKSVGGIADGVLALAGEEGIARMKTREAMRARSRSLLMLAVSALFSADVTLLETDGFNALPHFIYITLALIALIGLSSGKMRRATVCVGVIAAVISAVSFIMTRSFAEHYSIMDIAEYSVADAAYVRVELVTVIETVAVLGFIATIAVILRGFVRECTGIHPSSENYGRADRDYHAELTRKVYFTLGILAISVILKCVNILLVGSPAVINSETGVIYASRLPWLPTAIFVIDLFYFLRMIFLTRELREEMEYKEG